MKTPTLLLILSLSCCLGYAQTGGNKTSSSRKDQLDQAHKLVADSNYGKAISIYNRLLQTDSMDGEVYRLRGDLYVDMHDYSRAYADLTHAVHCNRKDPFARIQRAGLLYKMEYYDESINDYDAALMVTDKDSTQLMTLILVNRSNIKRILRQPTAALTDLLQAYSIDSSQLGVLSNLANILSELGRKTEAIAYLERSIRIDSTFSGGLGNLAFIYSGMGNYKKAVELNTRLLRIQHNEPFALNNRGYAKVMDGDIEGGLEDINNSILVSPYNSYAFRNRAIAYIKLHKKAEACSDLAKAKELGFSKYYGDEVDELIKKNCQSEEKPNKM